jgi:hypothetical protein
MHTTTIHQACAADGRCVLSEGTMHPREVLPKLLAALKELSPAAHEQVTTPGKGVSAIPACALDDTMHSWWDDSECEKALLALFGALNEHAPKGFAFDVRPGDRLGFFPLVGV